MNYFFKESTDLGENTYDRMFSPPPNNNCKKTPCQICIGALRYIWRNTEKSFKTEEQLRMSTKKFCTKHKIPAINYYCCTNQINTLVKWMTLTMKPKLVCEKINMC